MTGSPRPEGVVITERVCITFFSSPVNEDMAAPDPGRVDEVVALRDEVYDVLPRVVGRRDDQVLLVLNWHFTSRNL